MNEIIQFTNEHLCFPIRASKNIGSLRYMGKSYIPQNHIYSKDYEYNRVSMKYLKNTGCHKSKWPFWIAN